MKLISRQAFIDYMSFRRESCQTLAQKAKVSKAMIGHLRSGARNTCRPDNASAIEEALNAPPGSLFAAEVSHVFQGARRRVS